MWVIFAVPFDLASGRGRTWSGLAIPSGATRLRCTAEGLRSQRQGSIQSANRLCCLAVIVGAIPTALVLAILAVQVESPACPSRAEVEQALRPMLPALPEAKQGDMARIARVGRGLRIDLVSPQGALIAERSLEVEGTCAELATVAAIIIAAWESDVHPDYTLSGATETVSATNAPAPIERAPFDRQPAPATTPLAAYDVALGPSQSFADSFAGGGLLSGTWVWHGVGPGLRLFAAGEANRTAAMGQRQARWRRWMGGIEADWRLGHGRAVWEFHTCRRRTSHVASAGWPLGGPRLCAGQVMPSPVSYHAAVIETITRPCIVPASLESKFHHGRQSTAVGVGTGCRDVRMYQFIEPEDWKRRWRFGGRRVG